MNFDSLIPQTHFISLCGVSKMHCNAGVACLEALYASGIPPSDHFLTEQQQYRGIGDSSSWMKMTFFHVKIRFIIHIIIIQGQTPFFYDSPK